MNNSKLFPVAIMAFFMCAFLSNTFAQIEVKSDGRVAVGNSTTTSAQFNLFQSNYTSSIYTQNNTNTTASKYGMRNYVFNAGSGAKYGIYNQVQQNSSASSTKHTYGTYNYVWGNGSSSAYGVYNKTKHSGSGARYGLYNEVTSDGTGTAYGVNNSVSSDGSGRGIYNFYNGGAGSFNYGIYNFMFNSNSGTGKGIYSFTASSIGEAGYFAGDVYVSGTLTQSSDLATKQDIKEVNNALALIGQLVPKSYNYKRIPSLNLPKGEQYGFIAQDLERVLPTLVKNVEVVNPEELKGEGEQLKEIKSVNYIGLTPILVKAVQEQQDLIQQQQKLIEQLNQRLERLEQK